jgi:hypothetical protein
MYIVYSMSVIDRYDRSGYFHTAAGVVSSVSSIKASAMCRPTNGQRQYNASKCVPLRCCGFLGESVNWKNGLKERKTKWEIENITHKDLFMFWRKTQTEGGPPARPAARDFHTYLSKKLNSAAPSFLLLFFQMKIFQSFILPLRLWTADCVLYVHTYTSKH